MSARLEADTANVTSATDLAPTRTDQEGMTAGVLGAATIALWFLILDSVQGRPLFTPTVLGTALFRHGEGLATPETLPISIEMVFLFTWVHGMVFTAIGGLLGRLLAMAERNAHIGFGLVILFVGLEAVFVVGTMVFAETALRALSWFGVLVGNLLAAAAMTGYLWYRHPELEILP